jgi:hypothetical protein
VIIQGTLQGTGVSRLESLQYLAVLAPLRGHAIDPAIAGIVNARHLDVGIQAAVGLNQFLILRELHQLEMELAISFLVQLAVLL